MKRAVCSALLLVACTKEPRSSAPSSVPDAEAAPAPVAAASAPSHSVPATNPNADPPEPRAVNPSEPLILRARSLREAFIENTSSSAQYVLHNRKLQPSRLRLYAPGGAELEPRDQRDRMKFDTTASLASYRELAPGDKVELFEPQVKERGGVHEVVWGPFTFGGLASGTYSASLEWTSARNDYVDEAGQERKLDAVWLGTIRSARFDVAIP